MQVFVAEGGRQAVAKLIEELRNSPLGEHGGSFRIIHDADGAPSIAGSPLNISISHSPHFAALAVDPNMRIGVDIEEPRIAQLGRVISKFLTDAEMPLWGNQLLRAWTAKEATFKAAGVADLTIGRILLPEADIAEIHDGRQFLLDFTETPDYTLTTAVPLTAETLYQRGKRRFQLGNRSGALSDFNRSALIDPTGLGSAAARHLTQIFDFFNPDLYNP